MSDYSISEALRALSQVHITFYKPVPVPDDITYTPSLLMPTKMVWKAGIIFVFTCATQRG